MLEGPMLAGLTFDGLTLEGLTLEGPYPIGFILLPQELRFIQISSPLAELIYNT